MRSVTSVDSEPHAIAVLDADDDGAQDLAVANAASNTVSVLRGDGRAGFGSATTVPTGRRPAWVVAADFDRYGDEDLAVTDFDDHTVRCCRAPATAASRPRPPFPPAARRVRP